MWLFTTIGFFSVVQMKNSNDFLMVRARYKGDIEALLQKYLRGYNPILIAETNDTDYRFRVAVDKGDFAIAMAHIVNDITYTNFKNEVALKQGYCRASDYLDVWSIMRAAQMRDATPHKAFKNRVVGDFPIERPQAKPTIQFDDVTSLSEEFKSYAPRPKRGRKGKDDV